MHDYFLPNVNGSISYFPTLYQIKSECSVEGILLTEKRLVLMSKVKGAISVIKVLQTSIKNSYFPGKIMK